MVGDLCKPLSTGETRTVRVTMQLQEARELLQALDDLEATDVPMAATLVELRSILKKAKDRALER